MSQIKQLCIITGYRKSKNGNLFGELALESDINSNQYTIALTHEVAICSLWKTAMQLLNELEISGLLYYARKEILIPDITKF